MDDLWMRVVENMSDRVSGPMKHRFILQPLIVCIFSIIDGLKDARAGSLAGEIGDGVMCINAEGANNCKLNNHRSQFKATQMA